jgi:hypothetical protein
MKKLIRENMLSGFINTERSQYVNKDNNKFAFALGQASRYYGFLLIILDRCEKASRNMISTHEKSMKLMSTQTSESVPMTVEQMRLMEESSRLMTLVHLEIESYYLFAKIFLDNVARFLYLYFRPVQGVSLKSHRNLATHHKRYCEVNSLAVPQGFSESIMLLKERICDYRDDMITHEMSLRIIKGTAWGTSRDTIIAGATLYPREGDSGGATSEALPQLMDDINIYIRQIFTMIETNREKSRLRLRNR